MGDPESKHDKFLQRTHLWVAILGGLVTLAIGVYNFKHLIFPEKAAAKSSVQTSAGAPSAPLPSGLNNLSLGEWKGEREDFNRLDLDGNGVLSSQDLRARFEDMDKNGDGSIPRFEWRKTRRAFDALDTNKDGKITPDEFARRNV